MHHGIVLGCASGYPPGQLKEISEVIFDIPVMSPALLNLMKWMADYYLAPEGVVLKSMAFMDYFNQPGKKVHKTNPCAPEGAKDIPALPQISPDHLSPVIASLSANKYATYLLHEQSLRHEISSLLEILRGICNIIILVPEITHIRVLSPILKDFLRDRLTILHGGLSKGQRRNTLYRILSGDSDIVIGTRIAVFAPLQRVSLLCVLEEQNRAYKNLEGARYHGRDVAVMRGYLGKSTVALFSAAPSLESFHNTVKGKYTLLPQEGRAQRPRIEVIPMKSTKKMTPYLSLRSIQSASNMLKNGKNVLFLINRKGYSLIECAECNNILMCPDCGIPLIYHKIKFLLKCHYCPYTSSVPEACPRCRSLKLDTVGAGTQRIAADLQAYLKKKPLRLDSDAFKDEPGLRDRASDLLGHDVVVATRAVSGRLSLQGTYGLCVFLNPDIGLHLPDFRSSELLFQEIIGVSEHIRYDGLIIIQTKMPEHHVFRFITGYRFKDFFTSELSVRKSLAYPPFSRLIVLKASSLTDLTAFFMKALSHLDDTIEMVGPLHTRVKGTHVWKVLLKSAAKERLGACTKKVIDALRKEKRLRIVVDVDPISV